MADKMTTTPETLGLLINEAISWKPQTIERVVAGISNEVYKLKHSDNEYAGVIIRIHRGEYDGFAREQWAMDEVSRFGVPTPKIVKIDTFDTGKELLTYCVESELEGLTLSDLLDGSLTEEDRVYYAKLSGELLAKIHMVRTIGFGHLIKQGEAEYKSLQESMDQNKDHDILLEAANAIDLSGDYIEDAISRIDKISSIESPHLLHIDYAPKHIFINNKQPVGIIDFEACMSGITSADINRWRTQESRITIKELISGYENVRKLPSYFWDTMYLVQVHSALRSILYHFRNTQSEIKMRKAANELTTLLETKEPLHF